MLVQDTVAKEIKQILDITEVSFNIPPKREMGDFSTAVSLAQAKRLKKPPMQIAEEIKEQLAGIDLPFIREISVTAPGYLNFKIDHPAYVQSVMQQVFKEKDAYGRSKSKKRLKVLIEHTNVNPNKAMHIGHIRNAIIGDTVSRTLRASGYNVEVCNYIDDTGVQVADVVVGMLYMYAPVYGVDTTDLADIWAKYDTSQSFDYWCWDLYARVQEEYEKYADLRKRREEVLHELESHKGPIAEFGKEVATKIVHAHLATVARLNIFYDLLNWESDILERGFWKTAFEKLKQSGAVVYETKGPNAGCWVVRYGRGLVQTKDGVRSEDKILVRSNGTVTYTGKDIAYQMWKFGVLENDFLYKLWGIQPNGQELFTTAPDGEQMDRFGHAGRVINVIDVRQSYAQQIVYQSLRKLGYVREAKNSEHLGYEIVVLSASAAAELGEQSEDVDQAGIQAMSGRKGLGVKADDLLNRMIERLMEKVEKRETAEILAAAAVRYFMSRFGINKMIVFDFNEALRTTGDTGIYIEYAHARACSILAKAGKIDFTKVSTPEKVTVPEMNLIRIIEEYPSVLERSGKERSPSGLARYAFDLASAFTDYYENPDPEAEERVPFIKIKDPELRAYRLSLVAAFRQTLANVMNVLGIVPLERI
ncbi:MAG TPA: arginine--tRNA ligase [Armatimonadota bacterium]|nr:arginine--tRNA ligase [Armatimonadota bacterium]